MIRKDGEVFKQLDNKRGQHVIHFWLLVSFVFVSLFGTAAKRTLDKNDGDSISIKFLGGAGRVSGSMSILSIDDKKWMIDCGAFYPEIGNTAEERQQKADEKTSKVTSEILNVDGILLTHAHLDHIGRLPLLVRKGFKRSVYATEPTIALAKTMLLMQIRYESSRNREWIWSTNSYEKGYVKAHWNSKCQWSNRIKSSNKKRLNGPIADVESFLANRDIDLSPCKVCAELDLDPVMALMKEINLDTELFLSDSVSLKAVDAGHIPGSCSFIFEFDRENRSNVKILFSGDLGTPHSAIIEGPPVAEQCDIIIAECTYGCAATKVNPEIELLNFRRAVADIVNSGGVAWIPAFALDRSQKVLHQIRLLQKNKLIGEDVPIFMPSPTANKVNDIYKSGRLKGWFRDVWERDLLNLYPPGLQTEWIDIEKDKLPKPSILITTSGMMERAFSEKLLDKLLPQANVSVFLVGYQDPFSPGGLLEKMAGSQGPSQGILKLDGADKDITVRAEVQRFSGFSSHAKADDMDRWLQNQDKEKAQIILVHGALDKLEERESCMQQEGWKNVHIAHEGQTLSIE